MRVEVDGVVSHAGSIVVLSGIADDGRRVDFGAETRCAAVIAGALAAGEPVDVELEGWEILRTY